MNTRIPPKNVLARQAAKNRIYAGLVFSNLNNCEDRNSSQNDDPNEILNVIIRSPISRNRKLPATVEAHKMTEKLLDKMRHG